MHLKIPALPLRTWLIIAYLILIILSLPRMINSFYQIGKILGLEDLAPRQTGIILGAGLNPDNSPTQALLDRLNGGILLYQNGIVDQLIMSSRVPEPEVMRDYALHQGVPREAILIDEGGTRTYNSCYQAANKFDLDEIILISNNFHLPRALYLCQQMGVSSQAFPVAENGYPFIQIAFWQIRETLSTILAWWDINVRIPIPTSNQ